MTFPLEHRSARGFAAALFALALACSARTLHDQGDPCLRCHGDAADTTRTGIARYAPPRSVLGSTDPADSAVGAHHAHLADGAIRRAIECRECHVVPQQVQGHFGDGAGGTATVTFGGALGRAHLPDGVQPTYDRAAAGGPTCTNVYCHGATLAAGGTNHAPRWTGGAAQAGCGTCHGLPPPSTAGHPQKADCNSCHPGYTSSSVDVATHIDGTVDAYGLSCTSCHGNPARSPTALNPRLAAAPPADTSGNVDTTFAGVGAHQAHLQDGPVAGAFACTECHVVPANMLHSNGTVDLSFGGLATTGSTTPTFSGGTCTNYCHGATLEGGQHTAPAWTTVDGSQITCDSCHGYPPSSHSGFGTACHNCHPGTVLADDVTIDVAGGLHVNGLKDATIGSGCAACHGYPPATGAHLAHASPAGTSGTYGDLHTGAGATPDAYDFGCGECHPTDASAHTIDAGAPGPDVVLVPPATCALPTDDVKCRNAADAAYDPNTGTCSGVYCHSSGQETPAYVVTPDWRSPPAGGLGCDACHANPPKYLSGAGGSPTANSHVFFDDFGWEAGHFAGLPGPGHNSKHGGGNQVFAAMHGGTGTWGPGAISSPMTCQTCHYATVDPSNVLAGRFFYFDTSGRYDLTGIYELPGGDATRFDTTVDPASTRSKFDEWRGNQCSYCHDGVFAPIGVGKVLAARHVNGVRDVDFDPRTTYGGTPVGLPALPDGSVLRPYYMTDEDGSLTVDKVAADANLIASTPQVMSLHLANATYDAQSKTCSNIACHLAWQANWGPATWGSQDEVYGCSYCHLY